METLSNHITLLARNGKPITSIMGMKRVFYRFKRQVGETTQKAVNDFTDGKSIGKNSKEIELLMSQVIDKLDIDVSEAVKCGMVREKDLKRVLIRFDYDQMAKQGVKYKEIKGILSDRYGWSVSSIEKLVYSGRFRG
jgi:hypothetical protein